MEENVIQEPETQVTTETFAPEKIDRKPKSKKKSVLFKHRRKPSVPKVPLGMLNEPTAKEVEIKKSSTPWKPARVIDIPESYKDPRFTYRWCNTLKMGNIQKKIQEGWEIDKILSKKLNELYGLNRTLEDGSPMDSTVKMRELIVMRIPKEMAEERNEYYRKRGQIDRKSIEKGMRENLNETSDPANILGRSTLYSERKLERI